MVYYIAFNEAACLLMLHLEHGLYQLGAIDHRKSLLRLQSDRLEAC
jgi:hypothetical protein